jgi:hypothetical protein
MCPKNYKKMFMKARIKSSIFLNFSFSFLNLTIYVHYTQSFLFKIGALFSKVGSLEEKFVYTP